MFAFYSYHVSSHAQPLKQRNDTLGNDTRSEIGRFLTAIFFPRLLYRFYKGLQTKAKDINIRPGTSKYIRVHQMLQANLYGNTKRYNPRLIVYIYPKARELGAHKVQSKS